MKRLDGKVAIITGSTLGLGKAAALIFAREGAKVVTCDRGRSPENAQKLLKAAEGLSGEIVYKRCDVMNQDDIVALCDFTKKKYGRVDVMVNNAIIENPGGKIEDVNLRDWEETIFCHMTAPLLFCKEVIPSMVKQGGGNIINVASHTGLVGGESISSYGPAKAGMINLTKNLAVTYGMQGIRANILTPARMLTEKKFTMLNNNPAEYRRQAVFYPLGSPSTPEQVADTMLFLASDESAAITGHNLIADRGVTAQDPMVCGKRSENSVRATLQNQGITAWINGEE
ncbi:MAG TPA: short-chain dehydrogenase [Candidatus Latescibacteria bacterium]|jgi:NAD(P)-dependent dehydrogenase (short-subunit alcohol dehydrogenase family)|nr:short-chain dehydrogenase [Candidatus Latescibacterota bacterium]